MPHPSEQVELPTANGVVDIQFDNYNTHLIRVFVFENGPGSSAATAKLTHYQARALAYEILRKADWLRQCSENQRMP